MQTRSEMACNKTVENVIKVSE